MFKSKVWYNHAGFCCALRIQEETVFGIEGYSSETMVERSSFRGFLSKWPLHFTMRDAVVSAFQVLWPDFNGLPRAAENEESLEPVMGVFAENRFQKWIDAIRNFWISNCGDLILLR